MVSAGSNTSKVFEFNTADDSISQFAGPAVAGSYSFVMGALDPVSGIFYVGTYTSAGVDLYGFDTDDPTPTAISGRIAQIQLAGGGSGGDMVFDATGHLYIVSGGSPNVLVRVDQAIPTTGTDAQLTSTELTALSSASPNGVTFDGDGYLYVSSIEHADQAQPEHRGAGGEPGDPGREPGRQHRRSGRLPVQR